jgi:hypothetical protein
MIMKTPLLQVFRLASFALLLSFLVISCTDNNESTTPDATTAQTLKTAVRSITAPNTMMTNQNDMDHASDYLDEFDCFDLVFPLDVTDGTTNTAINSYEELFNYYENLPASADPNFVYPIIIQYEDGTQATINNEEDVEDAFDECYDEFDDCFTLNFPITLTDESGNSVTVNDEEALSDFWDANATATFEPTFVYPITVTLTEDGSTLTINNDEEFDDLFEECYDFEDYDIDEFDCFSLQYPVEASSTAGGTTTINSNEEMEAYFESLGEDEESQFTFPITILYEDGTQEQVNSLEELEEAFDECYDEYYEEEDCFEFSYPLTLIKEDNTTVTVNSDEEFETFLDNLGDEEGFGFQYPFNIIQDGETLSINSEGQFFLLFDDCF